MANIGLEVIRLALSDATKRQKEITDRILKNETDTELVQLIHEQSKLITSTAQLFDEVV